MSRLKVLMIGPNIDGTDVGGVYAAFRWCEAIAKQADVTLLTLTRSSRAPIQEQLPQVEVVAWDEPEILWTKFERFNATAKPYWPIFALKARRWIKQALKDGRHFDVAHQIAPQAARFPCPASGLIAPFLIGPLDGGLQTPPGFAHEVKEGGVSGLLRRMDDWRIRNDPWLRRSYSDASTILVVAPYMKDRLAPIPTTRIEIALERANEGLAPEVERQAEIGRLKLLHVGRVVRTKALRDVVRAMAKLRDLPGVTLTSAGDGPDLDACKQEANALGVADRVTFLGRVSREEVERLYRTHDVFAFPSFREPMGGVVFEAMRWGMPVIAADYGGPGFIIGDQAGVQLPITTPEALQSDIADVVRKMALDPALRAQLSQGSHERLVSFGSWDEKAAGMIQLYREGLNA